MNLLFIHVPKTGGTSIIEAFGIQRLFGKHIKSATGRYTIGHSTYSTIISNKFLTEEFLKNAFIFTFVRNPYDQVVSHWAFSRQHGKHKCPKDITFLQFCQTKVQQRSNMRPQVEFIDGVQLDFLGRFENLNEDVNRLAGALDAPLGMEFPHLNKSKREPYQQTYCPESKEIVEYFYKRDFEELGYDIESL